MPKYFNIFYPSTGHKVVPYCNYAYYAHIWRASVKGLWVGIEELLRVTAIQIKLSSGLDLVCKYHQDIN